MRSANRSARLAEQSLLVSLRPLLVPSRFDDPAQKVGFADDKWFKVPGGAAAAEAGDEAVYFVIPLRNVGTGIGVLHGWKFHPDRLAGVNEHAPLEEFHLLSRDLYISPNDVGFWQGALRDPSAEEFAQAREVLRPAAGSRSSSSTATSKARSERSRAMRSIPATTTSGSRR